MFNVKKHVEGDLDDPWTLKWRALKCADALNQPIQTQRRPQKYNRAQK